MLLLSLPREMLSAIFREFIDSSDQSKVVYELANLRLVCKTFAGNYDILQTLFSHVHVIADAKWHAKFAGMDLSVLAPHVRYLAFAPSTYDWEYTFEQFSFILSNEASRRRKKLVKATLSEVKRMQQAYEVYTLAAAQNNKLFKGDSCVLKREWVRIIEQLPRCDSFSLRSTICDSRTPSWFAGADPYTRDAMVDLLVAKGRFSYDCMINIMESFIETRVTIRQLSFNQIAKPNVSCGRTLEDSRLNLSQLVQFNFEPKDVSLYSFSAKDSSPRLQPIDEMACVLRRSGLTLERFTCGHIRDAARTIDLSPLPNLKVLHVHHTHIHSKTLASWITSATKLNHLTLNRVSLHRNERRADWKTVFDAIRSHPCKMEVALDVIHLYRCELPVPTFHTGKETPLEILMAGNDDFWKDLRKVLPMYIMGKEEWTGSLPAFFNELPPVAYW